MYRFAIIILLVLLLLLFLFSKGNARIIHPRSPSNIPPTITLNTHQSLCNMLACTDLIVYIDSAKFIVYLRHLWIQQQQRLDYYY